eukprot:411035_1
MPDYASRLAILSATLRKSPISKDVDLAYLAAKTDKFSGADLNEICQTACKLAIGEDIAHEATLDSEDEYEESEEDEFLPELLPRHFEEAVRAARRSVSDRDLAQYSSFAKSLQGRGGSYGQPLTHFTFPQSRRSGRNNQDAMNDDEDLYS